MDSRKTWTRFQKPDGESSFNEVFGRYRDSAKRRGHSFELTKEQFKDMTQLLCHYCGAEPSNKQVTHVKSGCFIYNGVDRKDNTKGYVMDNCVPCCLVCNRGKNKMSYQEYVAYLTNLLSFHKETITQ